MALALPQGLVDAVKEERAVLFLGAGASRDAVHPRNLQIPASEGLRDFLCDRFFGGSLHQTLEATTDGGANRP